MALKYWLIASNRKAWIISLDIREVLSCIITICRMHSTLLMTHQNMINGNASIQCIVNMQDSTSRISKDIIHAFRFEAINQYFSAI
jgi:hypothetical protein